MVLKYYYYSVVLLLIRIPISLLLSTSIPHHHTTLHPTTLHLPLVSFFSFHFPPSSSSCRLDFCALQVGRWHQKIRAISYLLCLLSLPLSLYSSSPPPRLVRCRLRHLFLRNISSTTSPPILSALPLHFHLHLHLHLSFIASLLFPRRDLFCDLVLPSFLSSFKFLPHLLLSAASCWVGF
jgi:hypothetical protein